MHDLRAVPSRHVRARAVPAFDPQSMPEGSCPFTLIVDRSGVFAEPPVRIFYSGRLIGVLTPLQARALAPLLIRLDEDGVVVTGAVTAGVSVPRIHLDLPDADAVASYADGHSS